MVWSVVMHLVGLIVDLISGAHGEAEEKDLQIALLRHQVRLLQRRLSRPPRLSRWEKLTLAALTARLTRLTHRPQAQLAQILLLVRPETVLNSGANDECRCCPPFFAKFPVRIHSSLFRYEHSVLLGAC